MVLAHTNTTRNVSVRARVCVRVWQRDGERERDVRSLWRLFLLPPFFFVRHTGKEGTFSCCGSPSPMSKNTAKSSLFFLPFFVSFLFFCLFYFLISPIKKIIPREEGRIFFRRRPLFFLCVCFFLSLTTATQEGDRKISLRKSEKGHPFFPWIRTKSTLKKNESNVTCSSLSFFFEE